MKRAIVIVLALVAVLAAVLVVRAMSVPSMQISEPPAQAPPIDRDGALSRLSRAVQFRTVSATGVPPGAEHSAFVEWIAAAYPRVHSSLRREVISGHSLLYTWPGTEPSLAPVVLMGHYDVVPVEPGTESKWEHPPFSGAVAGDYVWGRGTLDDKITVIGLLEAVEMLLTEGFRPRRTILLAFGHDEELGGSAGAVQIAKLLVSRGIRAEAVIDEGGAIMARGAPGVTRPTALVAIAEKGITSVEIRGSGAGGHSSMPPRRTQVGRVAAAVDRVQNDPFAPDVRGAAEEMFRWLAPEMSFGQRLIMSNLWLFEPLVKAQARTSPILNASLRTTTAPTIIEGGIKENVIPSHARAVINFRILPGDTADGVLAHVRRAVDDDTLEVRQYGFVHNPSPVSNPRAPQFRTLQRTIAQVFPGVIVAPMLAVGATDSRHFTAVSPNIYRFIPIRVAPEDLARVHGMNERVKVGDYLDAIRFYRVLAVNFGR